MKIEEKGLRFGLLYVSFVGLLALFNFGLQSESEFLDVFSNNVLLLVFALFFMLGCVYFLRFLKDFPLWSIPLWIAFWVLTYLLILGLAMVFFVTLNQEMIEAIHLSDFYAIDVLKTLLKSLPSMLWGLLTLQNVHHYLDMLYTLMIELGFLSPLAVIIIKKDCQKEDICV